MAGMVSVNSTLADAAILMPDTCKVEKAVNDADISMAPHQGRRSWGAIFCQRGHASIGPLQQ